VAERYYSQSMIVLMFTVPYGFLLLKKFLDSKFSKPVYSYVILSYFLIIPFFLFKYNFPKTDLSKTKIGHNLAKNILFSLPKKSILFVFGDNVTFDVWYAHYVLNLRSDVEIINMPNVGNNIYINKVINDYYSKNPNTDLKLIISNTLNNVQKNNRVFLTNPMVSNPKGTLLIPRGLVYEVIKSDNLPTENEFVFETEKIWKEINIQRRDKLEQSEQNFIASEIPLFYSRSLVNVGNFIIRNYNNSKKAEEYFKKAVLTDDNNSAAYAALAASQFNNENCESALKNIKVAIKLYPVWNGFYLQQYYYVKKCHLDINTLNKLKHDYQLRFRTDIEKAIIVK